MTGGSLEEAEWNASKTGFTVHRSGTLRYKEYFNSEKGINILQMERPSATKT